MKHDLHSPKALRYGGHILKPDSRDGDYALVRKAIEYLTCNWQEQPSLSALASHLELGETATQKLFTRWAGISPKAFSQAITLDHAKRLLRDEGLPLLDASFELGLSSPSRLHDLFVTHEAMPPGVWKARGGGLVICYGYHACPFGQALVMTTLVNGVSSLVGVAFCDAGEEVLALEDMKGRWPEAKYEENSSITSEFAVRIFKPEHWAKDQPLRVTLIGTDFQIRVWDTLLSIPMGEARTYTDIADAIENPKAVRAVGAAVGKNPISFVVPCHRALGKSGALTGYHWGLTRKRAMLGWEAGVTAA
ncbi:MAG: bifunctional helix-turn-helix domain-containing protein/methylated-DNA--[protein]-cysteine S-methyltransferase [Rhizobiaceae bacterium]|nr:bifunctional helix-turn-helix domain-containing protein/methylated-DNA--[protein]-cysteine S-methyltransferase [Rhizobiaceae bacterium]